MLSVPIICQSTCRQNTTFFFQTGFCCLADNFYSQALILIFSCLLISLSLSVFVIYMTNLECSLSRRWSSGQQGCDSLAVRGSMASSRFERENRDESELRTVRVLALREWGRKRIFAGSFMSIGLQQVVKYISVGHTLPSADKFNSKSLDYFKKSMTDFSRNSRNQGPYTESNTVERSKEGPTHPYSGDHSESASQYSGSANQEEAINPSDYNFEMNLQYIMPLISTIKQENEHLKDQKGSMEKDMSSLNKLSQMLLKENQQLRKHYGARTGDIKKLIETISINTHEDIGDVSHQCFLLKESNCLLVKQIEGLIKQLQEKVNSNALRQEEINQLAQRHVAAEQSCRDMQVNNKQLSFRCQQAQLASSKVDITPEDERLNELLCQVVALKNTNRGNLQKAKALLSEHSQEKPVIEDNLTNLRQKNQDLSRELQQLQEKMRAAEGQKTQKEQLYQKSSLQLVAAMKNFERGRNALADAQNELVIKKNDLALSAKRSKIAQESLGEIKKQKEKLFQMVLSKKEALKKKEEERKVEEVEREDAHKKRVKKMKEGLGLQEASANEEICSKISPESTMIQSNIGDSKEQFACLVQEVDDLRQGLAKLSNPLKEIVRMEYELRKRKVQK